MTTTIFIIAIDLDYSALNEEIQTNLKSSNFKVCDRAKYY